MPLVSLSVHLCAEDIIQKGAPLFKLRCRCWYASGCGSISNAELRLSRRYAEQLSHIHSKHCWIKQPIIAVMKKRAGLGPSYAKRTKQVMDKCNWVTVRGRHSRAKVGNWPTYISFIVHLKITLFLINTQKSNIKFSQNRNKAEESATPTTGSTNFWDLIL